MKTEKGVAGKCLRTTTTRRKRRPGKHAFVGTKGGRLITKLRVLGVEEQRALCKNRISSAIVCRALVRKMEESEKEVTEGRRRRRRRRNEMRKRGDLQPHRRRGGLTKTKTKADA